jgi:hypothetical protein
MSTEIEFDLTSPLKWMIGKVSNVWADLFREKTVILGPSASGKSTLIKILQDVPYYIDEYNHTQGVATLSKKNIKYNTYNPGVETLKFKIKRDLPGENLDAWKEIIQKDKPKGIILVLDLYGLYVDGCLKLDSEVLFRNLDVTDENGNKIVRDITPKEKFNLHVASFKTIQDACIENNIKITGMSVFLNKCDKWIKGGSDETEVVYEFKNAIKQKIDLLDFTKKLNIKEDISWAVTSLDKDLKMKYLEPALTRYASKFQKKQ